MSAELTMAARVDALAAGLAAVDECLQRACQRITALEEDRVKPRRQSMVDRGAQVSAIAVLASRVLKLEAHVKRLEEDRPAADSCDMRSALPELGEELGDEVDDDSPDCNCGTCPQGGPYTCIRHD